MLRISLRQSSAHQRLLRSAKYNAYRPINPAWNGVAVATRSFQSSVRFDQESKDSKTHDAMTKPAPIPTNTTPVPKESVVVSTVRGIVVSTKEAVMNPRATWQHIKKEIHHYWVGSKLLWSEIKITWQILQRVLYGHEMTRRERRQLVRTTTDMFRLVPFAVFVIVPFMEFLLPFALKLFPNMLPSTFQDSLAKEENLKKDLQMRLALAKFLQETLREMASRKAGGQENSATDILNFLDRARRGQQVSNEEVTKMARVFHDELTLANVPRPQLASMCRYMNLQPYGSDAFLRFQLRNKLRLIKEDDRRILWEGLDSLNSLELREACTERGMRATGVSQFKLKAQLGEWLELSTAKNVPIALLIMSRALNLAASNNVSEVEMGPEELLKSSISSLDRDTINEALVASASDSEEQQSLELRQRKIESLKRQQELIDEEIKRHQLADQRERERRESERIKKETAEKKEEAVMVIDVADNSANIIQQQQQLQQQASLPIVPVPPLSLPPTATTESSQPVVNAVPTATAATAVKDDSKKASPAAPLPVEEPLPITAATAADNKHKGDKAKSEDKEPVRRELSVAEIQALVDLASGSSLQREKAELIKLQATLDAAFASPSSPSPSLSLEEKDGGKGIQGAAASILARLFPKAGGNKDAIIQAASAVENKEGPAVARINQALLAAAAAEVKLPSTTTGKATRDKIAATNVEGDTLTTTQPSPTADELQALASTAAPVSPPAAAAATAPTPPQQQQAAVAQPQEQTADARLKRMLDGMLAKIHNQIDKTEAAISDRLSLLDRDGDGSLSAEELRTAVATLLKRPCSLEEAGRLVAMLDEDQDGKISLAELLEHVKERRESAAELPLDEQEQAEQLEHEKHRQQQQQAQQLQQHAQLRDVESKISKKQ